VSLTHNVAFTHWRSSITNRDSREEFAIEGVEVDLFGPDGRLRDIWMFRDPSDVEEAMLRGAV
jgi:hypothetical protein